MPISMNRGQPLPTILVVGGKYSFRPFDENDLALIKEASRDERITSITTVPPVGQYSYETGLAFIARQEQRRLDGLGWSLAISQSGTAIGHIGLWLPQVDGGPASIGYWVTASERGNKASVAAVTVLSRWAFQNLEIDEVVLFIDPLNWPSKRTAYRSGFTPTGTVKHSPGEGIPAETMIRYSLLRSGKGKSQIPEA